MISSKRSSQSRSPKRLWPRRQSSGWEIAIVLNDEFRAESINVDEPGIPGLNPDDWLGAWIDDIICSVEGDTFVSSAIVSRLDLQSFDLNVCIKSHPEFQACARIKKLKNGQSHGFLVTCFFWNDRSHLPYTRRDSIEQMSEDSELCFCDLDFDRNQFRISPSLWLMLGYSLKKIDPGIEFFRELVHSENNDFL